MASFFSVRVGLLARENVGERLAFELSRSFPGSAPSGSSEAALTHSGGTAPALHRLPRYALAGTRTANSIFNTAGRDKARAAKACQGVGA
jgi:hypothetical protein